ncbi:MAG: thiamine pyrophosphate-dependent enzyme [Sneathiella sp.]
MHHYSGTGASVLVSCLRNLGLKRIFGVPGESFISVLNEMRDVRDIEFILARHEGGASMMADAEAKLTGRPGLLMLARGPGAANAMAGLHVASQDSTPLIAFVGLVPRGFSGREAFQEIDVPQFFGGVAKWAVTVEDARRLPEIIMRAYSTACSGRPGPVVIGLPEDMLTNMVETSASLPMPRISQSAPEAGQLREIVQAINTSEKPLIIVGGSLWSDTSRKELEKLSTAMTVPVATAFRCQDYFDNLHAGYAGHLGIGMDPALATLVKEADCIIAIGTRLDEHTTGSYTLISSPMPEQPLIHIHPAGEELHKFCQAGIPVCCDPRQFVRALVDEAGTSIDGSRREDWYARAGDIARIFREPRSITGDLQLPNVMETLRELLPDNAVICNGAGNYAGWVHRYFAFRQYRTQLAPTSGSMGYGLPAAIASALVYPERRAIAIAGDGCLQMTAQEFATAAAHKLPIVTLVINNHSHGAIRMHQEISYPGRVYVTDLVNPNFVALAKSYCWNAEKISTTEEFLPAIKRALALNGPAMIELSVPIEALSAGASLSEIRTKKSKTS